MSNNPHAGAHKAMYGLDKHLLACGIYINFLCTRKKFFRQFTGLILNFFWFRADFIIFNSTASLKARQSRFLFYLAQLTGKKLFVYFRETEAHLEYDRKKGLLNTINWYMSKKITILTNSNVTHKMVKHTRYLNVGQKVKLIYAGNCAFVGSSEEQRADVEQHTFLRKLKENIPIVLNLGCAMQWIKGLEMFINTGIAACKIHSSVIFLWLGEGPDRSWALQRVKREGLQSRILLPGYINDPSPLLSRAQLVFITSRDESFSQVTAQAMHHAKDIVIMKGSGGPEELLCGLPHTSIESNPNVAAEIITTRLNSVAVSYKPLSIAYEKHYSPTIHAQRLSAILKAV